MPTLNFHAVDASRWKDFEALFEARGGPKACWCMVWRQGAKSSKGPDRKKAMKQYVSNGTPIGLLGYLAGEAVAWCSIAPKHTYRDLGGPDEKNETIWSLACFFIRRDLRGQGLAGQVIEAAVLHAKQNGATIVEAYPVDPDSPSYRFMGFVPMFVAAGFEEVGLARTRRHVMRRRVAAT